MRLPALVLALALPGCATLPEPTGGEEGLPNAGAGPFRALLTEEVGSSRVAPNVLADTRDFGRDAAVIDLDGDPATLDVAAFVAAAVKEGGVDPEPDSPTRSIVRYGATDGRSFDRAALVVLTADAGWEGSILAAPAALRVDGNIHLYYAAEGGIGLARGDAMGMSFNKEPAPVLGAATSGWAAGAVPQSPGVVRLADGTFRMFYEVTLGDGSTAIGEAKSADGVTFDPIGDGPVLTPAKASTGAGDPPYDGAEVRAPSPILATSSAGEAITRVYYGAVDASGKRTIGLAARYGDEGPLTRAVAPVFGAGKALQPTEPCVVSFGAYALLFATQHASASSSDPIVAAGVAPATAVLPAASP